MAIKFEHEESIYEICKKILEKSRSHSIASILYYLMRASEYGDLGQRSSLNFQGWDDIFEDDQVFGTVYTYYDKHNKREESEWFIYCVIEDNTIFRIKIVDRIGHLYFNIFDNADDYIVKTTTDSNGKQLVTIVDSKGKTLSGANTILFHPDVLPESIKLVDIVKPINLNELVDSVMGKTK